MFNKTPLPAKLKEKQPDLRVICGACHKRVRDSVWRASFTSWILRDVTCGCRSGSKRPLAESETDEVVSPTTNRSSCETQSPASFPQVQTRQIESESRKQTNDSEALLDGVSLGLQNRFDVLRSLGEGGMGSVYEVRDKSSGTHYALKMLKKELVANEDAVKRFQREAKTAMKLSHENLCTVYGAHISETNVPYLLMELVTGQSLAEILHQEIFLTPSTAVPIFLKICAGLRHAHSMHILHRDLKPGNVIINQWIAGVDQLKVVDFGIAKQIAPTASGYTNQLTQTGELIGSPLYMSPEQCRGEQLSQESDIYSFGCVMYEMLTGKPPFQGNNPVSVILQHLNDRPARFDKSLDVPPLLESIVFKCLAKSPLERYRSVDELFDDLKAFSLGRPLRIAVERKNQLGAVKNAVRAAERSTLEKACFTVVSCIVIFLLVSTLAAYSWLIFTAPTNITQQSWQLTDFPDQHYRGVQLNLPNNSNSELFRSLANTTLDPNLNSLFENLNSITVSGDTIAASRSHQSSTKFGRTGLELASGNDVSFVRSRNAMDNLQGLYIVSVPTCLEELCLMKGQANAEAANDSFGKSALFLYVPPSSSVTLAINSIRYEDLGDRLKLSIDTMSAQNHPMHLEVFMLKSGEVEKIDCQIQDPISGLWPQRLNSLPPKLLEDLKRAHANGEPMNVSIDYTNGTNIYADNIADQEFLQKLSLLEPGGS